VTVRGLERSARARGDQPARKTRAGKAARQGRNRFRSLRPQRNIKFAYPIGQGRPLHT
jgi:hypothetical protein